MRRPALAVPSLRAQCAVCMTTVPATPAAEYEGRVRLIVHDHPRAELGMCVGSRMVTRPLEGHVQLELFGELEEAA